MDAKLCDKCGKYYREINQVAKLVETDGEIRANVIPKTVWESKPGIHVTIEAYTKSPFTKKHYDLCPECAEKIMDFFSSGRYPMKQSEDTDCKHCGDCDHMFCAKFESKEEKTLSETLSEKLALPVEGAPNGPATDCKYCGRMIDRRKDVRACLKQSLIGHQYCTYKCTKFEPKEEEK